MAKKSMKGGTMLNPVPAVMVSCGDFDHSNIITIAWTGILNTNPPMTYVSVKKERFSHDIIEKNGEFVINLTTQDLVKATDFCGVRSGRDYDKFETCGLTKEHGEFVTCPMVAQSPVNLECKVVEMKEFPSHDMFIAEIVRVHADESLYDETDRMCLDKAGLVSYSHGEYFALKSKPLGRFGFSVMKPKTKKRINREKAAKRKKRK